jgi:hypothetical protein
MLVIGLIILGLMIPPFMLRGLIVERSQMSVASLINTARGVLAAGLGEVTRFDCDELGRDDEVLHGFMNRVGGSCV